MKSVIIGLTGPIASGKNTAAKVFGRHGAYIIDADKVGHDVIAPQKKAWHRIVRMLGSKVLNKGGIINRKKLGKIVFSNKKALEKLDRITHPEIRKTIIYLIKKAGSKRKLIVVNAAVLKEMKLVPLVDKVIVVLAKKSIRIKRMIRAGRSKAEALARISMQKGDAFYRKMADVVIENNKSISDLTKKVNSTRFY